jgi:hypothetical protein
MVLRQNTRCELKIRVEKKMNLLVLIQEEFRQISKKIRDSGIYRSNETKVNSPDIRTALGSDGQGPKGFSFGFLDLFDLFDLFADLARACLGFLERPSRSCEVVRVRSTHGLHKRTAASLDVTWEVPGPT